jgi:hypothetical protein
VDIFGFEIPNAGLTFFVALGVHMLAALGALVSGILAATARKRPGRHPRAGRVYLWFIGFVVASASVMAIVRWEHSAYLLALAVLLSGLATLGWFSRPSRYPSRYRRHAIGMGGSFIVLLTGFYVDNGAQLPVWDQLPPVLYWIIPALIGVPLILLALRRYRSGASRRPRERAPL